MDIIRIFFLFAISIVAFSQYLRSSSSQEVKDIKDRLRSYEDQLKAMGPEAHKNAQENEEFTSIKKGLYSDECKVPSDTIWYYILFFYLSGLIVFGSTEKFFNLLSLKEKLAVLYTYQEEITGGYCILGLLLCFLVFRSGYSAIRPKENARKNSDDLDIVFRTLAGNRNQ